MLAMLYFHHCYTQTLEVEVDERISRNGKYRVNVSPLGDEVLWSMVLDRVQCMTDNHPACLRQESLTFKLNDHRVFLIPVKEEN
jgi:hypothetical protein